MDLPPDLANGIILDILKNIRPNTAETQVSYIAATPKPRYLARCRSTLFQVGANLVHVLRCRINAHIWLTSLHNDHAGTSLHGVYQKDSHRMRPGLRSHRGAIFKPREPADHVAGQFSPRLSCEAAGRGGVPRGRIAGSEPSSYARCLAECMSFRRLDYQTTALASKLNARRNR
jgi:hypothetical protein